MRDIAKPSIVAANGPLKRVLVPIRSGHPTLEKLGSGRAVALHENHPLSGEL